MSPSRVARAKRERWARQVNADLVQWVGNAWWLLRHPRVALFVIQLRAHYALGTRYPTPPRTGRIRV